MRNISISILGLITSLGLGCADAFEIRRQELSQFRIAALGVVDGVADAAIWSGEGMAHSQAPILEWSLDGEPIGEGWNVRPEGPGLLGLRASSCTGDVVEARVSIGLAPAVPEVLRYGVDIGEDVSLTARAVVEPRWVETGVEESEDLRLVVNTDVDLRAHLMVAGQAGTVLELDSTSIDFLREEITFDDTEIESRTPVEPGLFHFLLLLQDLAGGNRWVWLDVPMGVEGDWVTSGERRFDLSADLSTGWLAVDIVPDDDMNGYGLVNPEAKDGLDDYVPPDCGLPDEPFDLDWIVNGRCGLDELAGTRVVLEVR